MPPVRARLLVALLFLCLFLQLSSAQSFDLVRRQDDGAPASTPAPTQTRDDDRVRATDEADEDDDEADEDDEKTDSDSSRESGEETSAHASESGSPTETPGLDDDDVLDSKNLPSPILFTRNLQMLMPP